MSKNNVEIKLTPQEQVISNYLNGKSVVAWEELAQFSKDPSKVKKKTLQKAVSDLKKKYLNCNLPAPFNCKFNSLTEVKAEPEQKLVKLRITAGGYQVPDTDTRLDAHIDFQLNRLFKRVKTRTETINLSDSEWEVFSYLHEKAGQPISIESFKDLVFKNFGSKTPHHWAESIKRTLTKLRRNIRELKTNDRLVTVMGGNTTYYMLK